MIQVVVYVLKYYTVLTLGGTTLWTYVMSSGVFIPVFLTKEAISNEAYAKPSRIVLCQGTLFDVIFEVSQLWVVVLLCFGKSQLGEYVSLLQRP